ncbi:MAG: IS5 family transposase [Nanoarchaeota archaeon]|nr:IS5 family transposase [Nanoarchaeota archaeon]
MIQTGFFDFSERFKALSKMGDPLEKLNKVINWEIFRKPIEKIIPRKNKSSKGGRPSYDCILMFKIIVLQILYNLSDDQTEFQIRDRFSFIRFLGILLTDTIPDAKTIWLFKENLGKNNGVRALFDEFENTLKELGFFAKSGQIVDASIIKAPVRRTGKKDNELIKNGKKPKNWSNWPKSKKSQTDMDARWTKKRNKSHFGYKSHTNIDKKHKFIREYRITDASVHDSRVFEDIYQHTDVSLEVYGDGAYRSKKIEIFINNCGDKSKIQWNKSPNKKLSVIKKTLNKINSAIRIAVEHVFARQKTCMKLCIRSIGLQRAKVKIGLANLVYNFTRFEFLTRSC